MEQHQAAEVVEQQGHPFLAWEVAAEASLEHQKVAWAVGVVRQRLASAEVEAEAQMEHRTCFHRRSLASVALALQQKVVKSPAELAQ